MKHRGRLVVFFVLLAAAGTLIWLLLPPDSVILVYSNADNLALDAAFDRNVMQPCSQERRIVVSECFGSGRLGNSMFIFASTLAIATRHGLLHAVPTNNLAKARLLELKTLFKFETSLPMRTCCGVSYRRVQEIGWSVYNPAAHQASSFAHLTMIGCFMQSWRYFHGHEDAVRSAFTFADPYRQFADEYLRSIKHLSSLASYSVTSHVLVAVHIRRGDMLPQKENYNVADERYIARACSYFRDKYLNATRAVIFVVASDDPTWARTVMERQQRDGVFVAYPNGTAEQDMAVLSSCHHAIVTSGSFGWWAAWLTGGDVVYFQDFVLPSSALWKGYKADDYYPPGWLGIA